MEDYLDDLGEGDGRRLDLRDNDGVRKSTVYCGKIERRENQTRYVRNALFVKILKHNYPDLQVPNERGEYPRPLASPFPCFNCHRLFPGRVPIFIPIESLTGQTEEYGNFCSGPCAHTFLDRYMRNAWHAIRTADLYMYLRDYHGFQGAEIGFAPTFDMLDKYGGELTSDQFDDIIKYPTLTTRELMVPFIPSPIVVEWQIPHNPQYIPFPCFQAPADATLTASGPLKQVYVPAAAAAGTSGAGAAAGNGTVSTPDPGTGTASSAAVPPTHGDGVHWQGGFLVAQGASDSGDGASASFVPERQPALPSPLEIMHSAEAAAALLEATIGAPAPALDHQHRWDVTGLRQPPKADIMAWMNEPPENPGEKRDSVYELYCARHTAAAQAVKATMESVENGGPGPEGVLAQHMEALQASGVLSSAAGMDAATQQAVLAATAAAPSALLMSNGLLPSSGAGGAGTGRGKGKGRGAAAATTTAALDGSIGGATGTAGSVAAAQKKAGLASQKRSNGRPGTNAGTVPGAGNALKRTLDSDDGEGSAGIGNTSVDTQRVPPKKTKMGTGAEGALPVPESAAAAAFDSTALFRGLVPVAPTAPPPPPPRTVVVPALDPRIASLLKPVGKKKKKLKAAASAVASAAASAAASAEASAPASTQPAAAAASLSAATPQSAPSSAIDTLSAAPAITQPQLSKDATTPTVGPRAVSPALPPAPVALPVKPVVPAQRSHKKKALPMGTGADSTEGATAKAELALEKVKPFDGGDLSGTGALPAAAQSETKTETKETEMGPLARTLPPRAPARGVGSKTPVRAAAAKKSADVVTERNDGAAAEGSGDTAAASTPDVSSVRQTRARRGLGSTGTPSAIAPSPLPTPQSSTRRSRG